MIPSPRPSDRRVQTVCLLTLTLIAVGFTLAQLQPVLVPFVLALFLSQCLAPLILLLMRRGLPRWMAVSVAVALAGGTLTLMGFVVAASVSNGSAAGRFATYQDSLNRIWHKAMSSKAVQFLGVRPETGPAEAPLSMGDPMTIDGRDFSTVPTTAPSASKPFAFSMGDAVPLVQNTIGQVAGLVSHSASVLLLMTFLLYGRRWDPDRPTRSADDDGHGRLVREIEQRVQQYISVTVLISLLTGVLVGAALGILGVQFAAVWGLLAFLLTFIPNFGGVIATVLPLPVILLDPQLGPVTKILAIAIPTGIQALIGSVVQPKLTGQSLDLHPVVILLSLLFFSMIWGVGGAFLAVPLTATFKIVFEKIPNLSPLAAALAGNLNPLTDTLETPAVEKVSFVPREQPEG